jgi:ubiquitin carboxyl-terminal hydrolase 7
MIATASMLPSIVSTSFDQQKTNHRIIDKTSLLSKGLINLGNTCYLNAQLECAFHIPKVRHLILSPPLVPSSSSPSDDSNSAALLSLQSVFRQMSQISSSATNTRNFCLALGINPYEQQDAQEFWKLLLPELNCGPLTNLYRGEYDTYISALDGSGRERIRREIFMDLSLDVSNFDHVMDSLEDMFTSGEILSVEEGNGWRPERGAEEVVDAIKGNKLKKEGLPNILQLHLMRFRHDWQSGLVSKINDRFVFAKVLDLEKVCNAAKGGDTVDIGNGKDDFLYDLQSVIVHAGEYGSGHYYAYVRPDVRRDEWFRYDDDRVTQVTFQEVQDDAFGGHVLKGGSNQHKKTTGDDHPKQRRGTLKMGFWKALWQHSRMRSEDRMHFGWGGRSSSAYMLQYVKRSDISMLYDSVS